ncbi:low-affinity methionine permease [Niveomyces insectorum RCEF 264]|uniref:Low-affinity methionine permease n=1 Tax=Niveomyces insectorum RCEF 264 TaxID=1081102 RepID=A0A162MRN9_9HYPO|nr:low-affinity methionine permease [Niveomyces insectorum RCEF 264]
MAGQHDDSEALPLLSSPPSPPSKPVRKASPDAASPPSSASASVSSLAPSDVDTASVRSLPRHAIEDDVLPETSTLGRNLSWQSAYILVISRVIGSGIFATPGTILRGVGSPGLSLLLWVVGAGVAACGLGIALEYGSMLPRSGGEKVYLEFTYQRPRFLASVLVTFLVVFLGFTASNCVVFSQYVLFAVGIEAPSELLRKGLAVGLLTVVTIVHSCFRVTGVRIQNVLGWLKVGLVVFMILSGLFVVLFRRSDPARQDGGTVVEIAWATALTGESSTMTAGLWDVLWRDSNWNWGVMATALFKVFYSYAGLENANNVLNEVKDPVRTLRSVTASALVTSCILYLLINVAYFLVVPLDTIKTSGELVGALFFQTVFGRHVGGIALALAIALSAAGNVMVVAFTMARVKQEIARQGFLPFSRLLSSTKPFGSPLGGFVVHYIPSFLVIVLPPSAEVYSFILEVEGYPGQFTSIAIAGGLLYLRYRRPELKRPFKVWIPAVLLKIALSLSLIAAPFFPPKTPPASGLFYATYAIVGVSILVAAVAFWYVWAVLIPHWRGYTIEEEVDELDDGTVITKLVKLPKTQLGSL